MINNPIIETQLWCVKGENEQLNLPGKDVWLPATIDLLNVFMIKSTGESSVDNEEFLGDNKTVIYTKTGDMMTINELYEKVNELFLRVKSEQYANSQ